MSLILPTIYEYSICMSGHTPMYNGAPEHKKLSGSVSLVLEPMGTAGGTVTVKVTDETPPTVMLLTSGTSDPITFTLYVGETFKMMLAR